MTLTEALAELGLQPGADAETVRRTYLRLIKTRKPESDPEGFRRAREAFEIARGAGEIAFFVAESERRHSASTPAAPEAAGAAPASDGDVATPPPAVDPFQPLANDWRAVPASAGIRAADPFQAFLNEWRAVPASASIRVRVEIARKAIAALPRDPRPYWLMVQTLSELGTDAEIAAALRAGRQGGWVEFLEALLARVPRLATVAEIDEALSAPSPTFQLLGAAALAPRDPARATSVVVELVRAARADGKGDIPVSRFLGVILALHEAGAAAQAAAAHTALSELLRDHGLELALLNGPLGGVWAIAGELARLPVEFPPALRRSFAASTRAGDLQSAFYDACFHARHHRREVVQWVKRTKGVAPNVSATLDAALMRSRNPDGLRVRAGSRWWLFFAVPCFLTVMRLCASNYGPSPYTHGGSQPPPSDEPPIYARARVPASMPMVRQAAVELCGDDWSLSDRLSCAAVRDTVDALASGDCDRAHRLIQSLKLTLQGNPPTSPERRMLTSCDLAWWEDCGRNALAPSGKQQ